MWPSLHGILFQKLQSEFCSVRPRVVRMHDQFPIGSPNMNSTPIRKWSENLNCVRGGLEFEPFGENPEYVKAPLIANYRKDHVFRLNRLPFTFWNRFLRSKSDAFMLGIEVEP
jgi:hypothetical protein